jgi:O-acetyl-ADP-ribose deacetylase (regulator of RNase III)
MKTQKGDLIQLALAGEFDVIVHGCNCHCQMGRGIALTIKQLLPEAYVADCQTPKSDKSKLGTISTAEIKRSKTQFVVVNAYTQFDWDGAGVKADYHAIRQVMKTIRKSFSGKRVGYPKIGAGLAGGDWAVIYPIICEELAGEDHTYVEYDV